MALLRQIRTYPGRHFEMFPGLQIERSPGRQFGTSPGWSYRIFKGCSGDVGRKSRQDVLGKNICWLGSCRPPIFRLHLYWKGSVWQKHIELTFNARGDYYYLKDNLRWCRAWYLFGSQIPVATGWFELRISCIRSSYLTD